MFFLFYDQGDFDTIMGLCYFSYSYTVSDIHPLDSSLFINIRFSHLFNEHAVLTERARKIVFCPRRPPHTAYYRREIQKNVRLG